MPASTIERAAIELLRAEVQRIPASQGQQAVAPVTTWAAHAAQLRHLILNADPRGFLTWDPVANTMFPPPYARFAAAELRALQKDGWLRWRNAIRESFAGLPFPSFFYPLSSTNAIHQAYHVLRFETATRTRIDQFETILEFGGGYGALCRAAFKLGFRGRYVMFDLPEHCALQRFYLECVRVPKPIFASDLDALMPVLRSSPLGKALLIGTWSLSEAPLDLRTRFGELARDFDAVLIAYQEQFASIDNQAFFGAWEKSLQEFEWSHLRINHLPGNAYLFGTRRESTGRSDASGANA